MEYLGVNKKSYDKVYSEGWGNRWPDTVLISIFYNIVKPLLPAKETYRILDFGCSIGGNTQFFKSLGFDVYGIDISENAIKKCIEIHGFDKNHFLAMDILKQDKRLEEIWDCKFDMILASNVLYYFSNSDLAKLLSIFYSGLETGGILLSDMVTYNNNAYRMLGGEKAVDGLIKVPQTGSVNCNLYVNLVNGKSDVVELFKNFKCIDIVRKCIDLSGENEILYFIGQKQN